MKYDAVIFCDCDGVLSNNPSCKFDSDNPQPLIFFEFVNRLNEIIRATNAKVVITSSWRWLIYSGNMTAHGFSSMLRSHGFIGEVIDATIKEEKTGEDRVPRHIEVTEWLSRHDVSRYVVIDDWGAAGEGHPFVQTNGTIGLTDEDKNRAIALLTQK